MESRYDWKASLAGNKKQVRCQANVRQDEDENGKVVFWCIMMIVNDTVIRDTDIWLSRWHILHLTSGAEEYLCLHLVMCWCGYVIDVILEVLLIQSGLFINSASWEQTSATFRHTVWRELQLTTGMIYLTHSLVRLLYFTTSTKIHIRLRERSSLYADILSQIVTNDRDSFCCFRWNGVCTTFGTYASCKFR